MRLCGRVMNLPCICREIAYVSPPRATVTAGERVFLDTVSHQFLCLTRERCCAFRHAQFEP